MTACPLCGTDASIRWHGAGYCVERTGAEHAQKRSPGRKSKFNCYLSMDARDEMRAEAKRLQRPVGWILELAWKLAQDRIRDLPGVP